MGEEPPAKLLLFMQYPGCQGAMTKKEAAPSLHHFGQLLFHQESSNPSDEQSPLPHLHDLIRPHIDSFNSIFDDGLLELAAADLEPRILTDHLGNRLQFWLEDVQLAKPLLSEREHYSASRSLLPRECRERGVSYRGKLTGRLQWTINGGPVHGEVRSLGFAPVMVRSSKCHLYALPPAALIGRGEEAEELGGYFIINGIERLMRLLIVARRNHPLALVRPSFAKRGPAYSQYGVQIRSVRADQTAQSLYLHYLHDGGLMVRFSWRKNEYLVPLVLVMRALLPEGLGDLCDRDVMEAILQGDLQDTFIAGRVEIMLRDFKRYGLWTGKACRAYLGTRFAIVMGMPIGTTPEDVGAEVLRRIVLVHLTDPLDKFRMLALMSRKLYLLVAGQIAPDNPDSPMQQELLLTGHLYLACLKEKLDDWLNAIRAAFAVEGRRSTTGGGGEKRDNQGILSVNLADPAVLRRVLGKVPSDLGKRLEYFLATGNLVSTTGLDLQQTTGYTVVAEKLNFLRYLAHFRAVHRGAFFAELKTTAVRKLMPEAWGFFCPVHTPDGAPCGLLNHLAHAVRVVVEPPDEAQVARIPSLLFELGVVPVGRLGSTMLLNAAPVLLDGRWVGVVPPNQIEPIARKLRHLKVSGNPQQQQPMLPELLEVASVPVSNGGLFAGLYLYTNPARIMRPVRYVCTEGANGIVQVGTFEQVYLDIAVWPEELPQLSGDGFGMVEIDPTNMLSVIANLIPFPDHNQSPRNMYQCQMGKQSMGTPAHALPHRTDNKLYRLLFGQSPIVRTSAYEKYGFDAYPNGANAIVAVISYTGYDMEDAMILNKSAYERGFGHASVYKTEHYDISDRNVRGEPASHHFGLLDKRLAGKSLDLDGLPMVGQKVRPDDPLFSVVDEATGTVRVERYKAFEEAYIDQVRLIGDDCSEAGGGQQRIKIKFRIPRNPVIGDKFSSRHGQKGVCSQRYPLIDMPFTESGMTPDIIINPHAFPSRMTIGMFVESMAAKAGALFGISQDATPFRFREGNLAAAYFGEQLCRAGYNYYGHEPMYSGVTGQEMRADIYIGIVYYQRLRHMVSDKFQVRTTGPVHNLTQQPVKGRKRAGGIRFGEMERDSLLAHGVAFLLKDRLMNCSDYSQAYLCARCGSILSPLALPTTVGQRPKVTCGQCRVGDQIEVVPVPFVFRYLAAELAAMNISVRLDLKETASTF